jgi:para-nitrobenzyl esterase
MRRLAVLVLLAACGDSSSSAPEVDITIDSGTVHGLAKDGVRRWFGIPYAAPPVGANRWRAPQPVTPWEGVRDALVPGEICPQYNPFGAAGGAEDCLFLNVFAADDAHDAPVMVWVHGGAFVFGSGSEAYYDGGKLAKKGVVVVSLNYRLGAFGSFSHPGLPAENRGNFGLLDQVAALQWVQRNIAAFGGDPANVTLFGESAGGLSACALYLSPTSHGLFARAISESGLCSSDFERTAQKAQDDSLAVATKVGCTGTDVATCLAGATVEDLTNAIAPPPVAQQPPGGVFYLSSFISPAPFIDGTLIPTSLREGFAAGQFEKRPLLLGTNRDEGTLFHTIILATTVDDATQYHDAIVRRFGANAAAVEAKYPAASFSSPNAAIAAVTGDSAFVCPTRRTARAVAATGTPVYLYSFEHELETPLFTSAGVIHSAEIPFVFGNDNFLLGSIGTSGAGMVDIMQTFWTSFAKTGDPGATWPKADATASQHELLVDPPSQAPDAKPALCDFWDAL